jgi:hypothetical protein
MLEIYLHFPIRLQLIKYRDSFNQYSHHGLTINLHKGFDVLIEVVMKQQAYHMGSICLTESMCFACYLLNAGFLLGL